MPKQAVLLLAHGTPDSPNQVPEYLSYVTGGRPLPPDVVEEVQRRYRLIGRSPLTEITRAQARLVEAELALLGRPVPVYFAMRNWHPFIADVLHQLRADGVEQLAVLCLAPQYSRTSIGLYRHALEPHTSGLQLAFVESWAREPLLAQAFAERLRPTWQQLSEEAGAPVPVLFTAHSVPLRTVTPSPNGAPADPYPEEARATAQAVAALLPEIPSWQLAFQSQGASGGPWLGPSVEEAIEDLARNGAKNLILHPIGFLCDHIEILYDVDHLYRNYSARFGVHLLRPESLNASSTLAHVLALLAQNAFTHFSVSQ